MPKIPKSPETPTVDIQLIPGARAQKTDVSSGLRQAAGTVAQLGDIFAQVKQRNDENEANDALLSFDDAKNKVLFNPNDGYYNTQGRSAVDGRKSTSEAIDKLLKTQISNIKSERAKRLFQRAVNVRVVRDKQAMMQHAVKGQKVWEATTAAATVENALNNAALYYNKDDELKTYMALGELAVVDQQEILGLSPEVTAKTLEQYRSSFMASAISGALARNQLTKANELNDKHGHLLRGNDSISIATKITAETDKQYISQKVNEIYEPEKTLSDMLIETRIEPDLKKRKEIERQIDNMFASDQNARNQQIENQVNLYSQPLEKGQILYNDIPSDTLNLIGPKGRAVLQQAERKFVTGKDVITDDMRLHELLNLPIEKLATVVPYEHYDYLNVTDRKTVTSAVNAAKKGVRNPDATWIQTKGAIVKQSVENLLGDNYDVTSKRHREQAKAYNDLITIAITAKEQAKGAKLTEQEFKDVNNNLIKDIALSKRFGFIPRTGKLEDIPAKHQATIGKELAQRGWEINAENMVKFYEAALESGDL